MTGHAELISASRVESGFDAADLKQRIVRDAERAVSAARFVTLAWPVPRVPSERLLAAETAGEAVLWAPPSDDEACGLGAALTLRACGPDRFQSIQNQARDAWRLLDSSRAPAGLPRPRFIGGFAFQPGQAQSSLWQDFEDARFVLPKLTYMKRGDQAWLRLIIHRDVLRETTSRTELEGELERALSALFSSPGAAPEPAREVERAERSAEAWGALVHAIQNEIAQGNAQKIVAARRLGLTLDRAPSPSAVQARLRVDAPESTRFAFRFGAATFLGATPEQLIRKNSLEIGTEAVAGSISANDVTAAGRLLESDKDIREHEFVVSEIMRLLGPLTRELSAAPREVHRLRTVLHLRTPISGILREPRHVLELVARLHPTPAVAGVPTRAAINFILGHEPDERGWYTGPVGWFDEVGDGRFVVALRSGLVCGPRAELYAGAGVVQDSNAPSEFAETRWKLAALLGALGVGE